MTARNRLYVESLSSVGLVADPDDEHATVELFKSKDFDKKRPEPKTKLAKLAQHRVNRDAIAKWAEQESVRLEKISQDLEALRQIPLAHEPNRGAHMPLLTEDPNVERDRWVQKHIKAGETEAEARVRYWQTHPEAVTKARTAGPVTVEKETEATIGEQATRAIDAKARSMKLEGRFFDMPLAELRGMVRKSVPGLVDLERSTETYSIAKSGDSQAHRFVAEWAH